MMWEQGHKLRVGKDLEEGSRYVFEDTTLAFAWRKRVLSLCHVGMCRKYLAWILPAGTNYSDRGYSPDSVTL
jgi:hypothetical protein